MPEQNNAIHSLAHTKGGILNQQGRRKAQFLVNAVQHYLHCSETPDIMPVDSMDTQKIETIMWRILAETENLPFSLRTTDELKKNPKEKRCFEYRASIAARRNVDYCRFFGNVSKIKDAIGAWMWVLTSFDFWNKIYTLLRDKTSNNTAVCRRIQMHWIIDKHGKFGR